MKLSEIQQLSGDKDLELCMSDGLPILAADVRDGKIFLSEYPPRKLTRLTAEEEKAWNFAFEFYSNAGQSGDVACAQAWQDVQFQFPRLVEFDGVEEP